MSCLVLSERDHEQVTQSWTKLMNKEGKEVPRRGNTPKREVLPDPVYGNVVVAKLILIKNLNLGSCNISCRFNNFVIAG